MRQPFERMKGWRIAGIRDGKDMMYCDEGIAEHPLVREIKNRTEGAETFVFSENLPFLERIVASDLPLQALKFALRNSKRDASYQLAKFVMEGSVKGWTFLTNDHFAISLGVREAAKGVEDVDGMPEDLLQCAPRLQPYPFDLFLGILHVDVLDLQEYRVIEPTREDQAHTLEVGGHRRMHSGSTMFLRAGRDVTVSTLKGALVYIEITGRTEVSILPQFDPATRAFCGWISGDPIASRLELLTRTLADFEHTASVPTIRKLTYHRDHYVRWNSVRHLLRLDMSDGVSRLRDALQDPHPEVREVAAVTLEQIESA